MTTNIRRGAVLANAASGSARPETVGAQVQGAIAAYFNDGSYKTVLLGILNPELDKLKAANTELKAKIEVLDTEVRALRRADSARDPPHAADNRDAFSGAVRRIIYNHLCSDSFFPSIPHIMQTLVERNAELDYGVVSKDDDLLEDEGLVAWTKRKKAVGKKLDSKVRVRASSSSV
jgi:hypothetical protein